MTKPFMELVCKVLLFLLTYKGFYENKRLEHIDEVEAFQKSLKKL